MIPLRDSEASHRLTLVNTALIIVNVVVFICELRPGRSARALLTHWVMVPYRISHLPSGMDALYAAATLVTSLFLHAGLLHLAGNMLYLFIFGPAVEKRVGHLRFLCFYLLAGIAAGLATVAMGPKSHTPVVGASGAIAGVLGGYFVLYPQGRITTSILIRVVEIPAIFYLLVWFTVQLYSGIASGTHGPLVGGIAWWAHVGGFLFGVATAPLLAQPATLHRRRS